MSVRDKVGVTDDWVRGEGGWLSVKDAWNRCEEAGLV